MKIGQKSLDKSTILIADDTGVMRHACERALKREGYRVIIAEDGEKALKLIRENDIDVALLDIKMPGISGIDVLREIKKNNPLVEVIMMTAFSTKEIVEEARNLGAFGFLTKPFEDIHALTGYISKAVFKKRLSEAGASEGSILSEEIIKAYRIADVIRTEFEPVKEGLKFIIEGVLRKV